MLVLKIFNKGFLVNQHSKSVTKPKCELQLHLALQQYILSASALLADLGEARGCSINSLVIISFIHSFINSVSLFLPQLNGARHAQTVRDSSSSYKIDYVIVIKSFLNPEGHQHPINGSKVTAILLKGWILPVGGASAVDGLRSTGLPRLVY